MQGNDNSAPERGTLLLIVSLTVALLGGFVALSLAGVDTTAYVLFCAGPIVSTAVGAVLSHKVNKVAGVVEQVKHQTNGIAAATAAAVQAHLTDQDITAAQVATAAAELAQRPAQDPVQPPGVGRPSQDLPPGPSGDRPAGP